MQFTDIVETVLDNICQCTYISRDLIKKSLNVFKEGKSDFCLFFNQISESPKEDAEKVYNALKSKDFKEITNICLGGTNISFNLNKQMYFKDILMTIMEKDTEFGKVNLGNNRNVVIDYSSPNIAKIFHVGHYRTTILGSFLKNLFNNFGYNSISLNYLGDWGKQFGLVILGFEKYGSEEKLKTDPLMHLFDVYVKINHDAKNDPEVDKQAKEVFRKMEEEKDEKYLSIWRYFREMSIKKYETLYKKLNIEFDVYSGESFYQESAKKFAMTTDLAFTDTDGSRLIDCGKLGKGMIMKSDGTTLYLTRDICAAEDRIKKYNPAKLVYVISCEQDQHMQQLFEIMGKMGYDKSIFEHVNFGFVHGMSTRNGTVHFLEDVIQSSIDAVKNRLLGNKKLESSELESTALILAVSTLLIADFGAKRIKGYTYDFDQRANCEKGSGAYLQYAHCRLNSIEEVNSEISLDNFKQTDLSLVDNSEVHDLAYKLIWYENILRLCLEDYEPSRLVLYLMDLCKLVNNIVGKFKVKGEPEDLAKARLLVLSCARRVLKNGMKILGLVVLNKM